MTLSMGNPIIESMGKTLCRIYGQADRLVGMAARGLIGSRIEEQLHEMELSQAELARRVGVHQSTINELIRKGGNSRYAHKIARELRTTPAYLSGETDDKDSHLPDDDWLSADEREWIDLVRVLEPSDRKSLLQLARSLAQNAGPSRAVHAKQHAYRAEERP